MSEQVYSVEVQIFTRVVAEDPEEALRLAEWQFPAHMHAEAIGVYDVETGEEL